MFGILLHLARNGKREGGIDILLAFGGSLAPALLGKALLQWFLRVTVRRSGPKVWSQTINNLETTVWRKG
jgi:hypothetical protein